VGQAEGDEAIILALPTPVWRRQAAQRGRGPRWRSRGVAWRWQAATWHRLACGRGVADNGGERLSRRRRNGAAVAAPGAWRRT